MCLSIIGKFLSENSILLKGLSLTAFQVEKPVKVNKEQNGKHPCLYFQSPMSHFNNTPPMSCSKQEHCIELESRGQGSGHRALLSVKTKTGRS